MRSVLIAVLALAVAGASPAARTTLAGERGPFLLVGLPSLGTVSWRCDERGHYALGFHAFRLSADDGLRFHAGKVTKAAGVRPGNSIRFPYVRARRQTLTVVQGTEPRTLRATVDVYFMPRYDFCRSYLVPRVDVRIRPAYNY